MKLEIPALDKMIARLVLDTLMIVTEKKKRNEMIKITDELGSLITVCHTMKEAKEYTKKFGGFIWEE